MQLTFLILILSLLSKNLNAQLIEPCSKNGALISIENNDASIIYSTNHDKIIYPASLVKMMTAYLVFEAIEANKFKFDDILYFSKYGEEISAVNKFNTLSIKENDKITAIDALKTMLVKSYNESAVILAEKVSDDEWNFVKLMNKKASQFGMINTAFKNASGLHHEGQYSTVADLAKLAWHLNNDFPQYYYLFGIKEIDFFNKKLKNNNRLLFFNDNIDGIKTGYTTNSGYNLIASAKDYNYRVFSVVVGCKNSIMRDDLSKLLISLSFEELKNNNANYYKKLKLNNF
jgi:D-alanyl-D-alanine carboxypeptidase (penicillin-binding protein 5/6)